RPVFKALGLTVGSIDAGTLRPDRRHAYHCDVTYGTAREFGFDFLRDRLQQRQEAESQMLFADAPVENAGRPVHLGRVQRTLHFALIDEADSLLIDEARIPLLISSRSSDDAAAETHAYLWGSRVASQFADPEHFTRDPDTRGCELTAAGRQLVRTIPKPAQIDSLRLPILYEFVERAIRVERDFLREREYVVRDGRILIVDEFTGRIAEGRQWRDGVHQAVEAKEGLDVTIAGGSAAQITVQELYSLYKGLAGMTGTASVSAGEFRRAYALAVATIPTHRPSLRARMPDCILPPADAKWDAVVVETRPMHAAGRPVVIGTRSIDKSEHLSQLLKAAGIEHSVLHARHLEQEAAIVERAGQRGQVTVATNMAGRGTDICLGDGVGAIGGLHVIGTELHDSSRIDEQLFGRSGRQGDPGSCRQFLSLDDEILDVGLGNDRARGLGQSFQQELPQQHLRNLFRKAQRSIEREQFRDRRFLMQQAERRRRLHERLGQDPYLDAL